MTKEQEDWLVAEVMDSMKMSETEERSARRYVKRAVDKILIYCNREDLPERLLSTAAQIAEDMLKADLVKTGEKEVASINRGDTAISYRDGSGNQKAINDANMKVSDHVLHYSFTINFRQAREQTNEFEPMGELEVAIRKGV